MFVYNYNKYMNVYMYIYGMCIKVKGRLCRDIKS